MTVRPATFTLNVKFVKLSFKTYPKRQIYETVVQKAYPKRQFCETVVQKRILNAYFAKLSFKFKQENRKSLK